MIYEGVSTPQNSLTLCVGSVSPFATKSVIFKIFHVVFFLYFVWITLIRLYVVKGFTNVDLSAIREVQGLRG